MSHRLDNIPVLYSVGTELAYQINENYYGGIHYVWCADSFDSHSQPPTSNPLTIMRRYFEICLKRDRHCYEISDNLSGIQRGAKAKLDAGVINKEERQNIRKLTAVTRWDAFLPVLYIIPTHLVRHKCIEVPLSDRASDDSYEYKIPDLMPGEFQVISFKHIFPSLIHIPDDMVPKEVMKRRRGGKV